jgi:hypothetical protein
MWRSACVLLTAIFVYPHLLATPALAVAGSCTKGSGHCLTLSGSHPAAGFMGFFMVVFVIGFFLALMGIMAVSQEHDPKGQASSSISTKAFIQLWNEPGWRLQKMLVFGGFAACFGSIFIGWIVMQIFGTWQ